MKQPRLVVMAGSRRREALSRRVAQVCAQAAGMLEPQVRLTKLDTEANQALAARFGIRSIPTLALFRGGREVARQAGAMGAADIVRWVRGQLG